MSAWGDLSDDAKAELDVERAEIETHVRRYIEIMRGDQYPGDLPFVQDWVLACEWTNVELERDDKAGRDVIMRDGGTLSGALGLGVYIRDRFGHGE